MDKLVQVLSPDDARRAAPVVRRSFLITSPNFIRSGYDLPTA